MGDALRRGNVRGAETDLWILMGLGFRCTRFELFSELWAPT